VPLLFFLIYLLFPTTKIFAQTPVTNPSSGIYVSEYLPNPNKDNNEWVEIFNQNSFDVILEGWKIKDSTNTTKSLNTTIPANGFYTLDINSSYFNNDGDTVNLINHLSETTESVSYTSSQKEISWSKQSDGSWCQTNPTKGSINNTCLNPPTLTPTITSSPTLTPLPTNTANPTPTTVSPNIYIDSAPQSVNPNQVFSLQFSIHNPSPNFEYRLKVVYGSGSESDKTCLVKTVYPDNTILNFNSSWSDFPVYKSSDSNTLTGTIKAVLSDCTNGSTLPTSLSVKIKSENDILSQNLKYIDIKMDPTSTPKPSSTPSPTSTPKPVSTTKPSSTPYPTSTPKKTLTPTQSASPSPTLTVTDTPTFKPSPEVLGEYDEIAETISFITPTPTPLAKTNQTSIFDIIPYFLITAGGGLLLTPTLVTKFKKHD